MRSCVASATSLLGVFLLSSVALAQATQGSASTGAALDQYEPTAPGDTFFAVPSPYARGHLVPRALAYWDYASQPLKLTQAGKSANVVGRQALLHIGASFTVQERLLIQLVMPVAVIQNGDSPTVSGSPLTSPAKAEVGDLRLGLRVRIVGEDDDPFMLGVGMNLHLPTAPAGSLIGDGMVREAPQLLMGGRFHAGIDFVWSAYAGAMIRASANPTTVTYGAGFAASLFQDTIQFGPEFFASTPVQDATLSLSSDVKIPANVATNAELLFGARVRMIRGLMVGWAAGPGLTRAVGTPELRFVGSIGWSPGPTRAAAPSPYADTDGDGIADRWDACPNAFGPESKNPKKTGCPLVDDDEDGIPNSEDACPNEYGHSSTDKKKNGCPSTLPPSAKPPAPAPKR